MAVENLLKKLADEVLKDMEKTHQEYQKYFLGIEKLPPLVLRRNLETKVAKLKSELATATSTSAKFFATSAVSRLQIFVAQWDKTMREIENGTFRRPVKRK